MILQTMKEDNISKLGNYEAPFYEQQYMHESCYISCLNSNQLNSLIPSHAVLNFRHSLSSGTIAESYPRLSWIHQRLTEMTHTRLNSSTCTVHGHLKLKLEYSSSVTLMVCLKFLKIFYKRHLLQNLSKHFCYYSARRQPNI